MSLVAACLNSGGNKGGFRTEPGEHIVVTPLRGNHYGDHAAAESRLVCHSLTAEGHDASEDGTGRGIPLVLAFDHCAQGSDRTWIHRANGKAQLLANRPDAIGGPFGVRRLTPREGCRLQDFPDDWLDGLGLSDSAKYRMLGNAVNVAVSRWLGRRIVETW